jgi:hypothetical protein
MNNYQIKKWIDGVINSCNTWDQISVAERLVYNFKNQLIKQDYDIMLQQPLLSSLDYNIEVKKRYLVEDCKSIFNN